MRALTLIPYAHFLLDRGNRLDLSFVKENLYDPSLIRVAGKVIKNDLEEVAAGWFSGGFDLWEERYTSVANLFAGLMAAMVIIYGADYPLSERCKRGRSSL